MTRNRTEHDASRNRLLLILIIISSIAHMDREIIAISLQDIKHDLVLSDMWIGLISGGPFAIMYSLTSIPLAMLADRGDRRRLLLVFFAIWIMLMFCCGLATSTAWLLIARMGVGMGEAGIVPLSHSLIAEAYPPKTRPGAYSRYGLAWILGAPLALGVGGWLVAHYGWRSGFFAAGFAGIPVLVIASLSLRNVYIARPTKNAVEAVPALKWEGTFGRNVKTFIYITIGGFGYSYFVFGPMSFIPTFLIRYTGESVASVGLYYGTITVCAGIVGAILGWYLSNRLGRRSPSWLTYLPAIALTAVLPIPFIISFVKADLVTLILIISVCHIATYSGIPSLYAAIQFIANERRRAVAIAVYFTIVNLTGMTAGPLATGWLSDLLAPSWHADSLKISMMINTTILIPAIMFWIAAGRRLDRLATPVPVESSPYIPGESPIV